MTPLDRMQQALRESELPAFLVSDMAGVFWLTGFTGSSGWALVTPETGLLLTDSRYTLQAQEQCREMPSRSFATPMKSEEFLKENIAALQITTLHFDEEQVTVGTHRKWAEQFAGTTLIPALDPIRTLRMKKSPQEVERIRAACRLTDACLEYLLPLIRPGVAESALQLEVELFLRRHGATAAFSPIVVSGERSARPHGTPSEKPLEVGDFVTFDIGARLDGYCSDITRTFVIGEASERHIEVYEQVLKGQLAALDALQPGANGKDVDLLVRAILDEKSFAAYFGHSLGHGLGALVHDAGRLSQTTEQPIEVGQVWTVEPGVYIEGFGGVRIEDDVLITERGAEALTHFPKRLMILGA